MANDHTSPEPPIRIFSYVGTPTNGFANDGDYYIDELVNVLYGPKTNGEWPEDGVPAIGVCKRSVYGISDGRDVPRMKPFSWHGFLWRLCNGLIFRIAGIRP
jgi:hypothetical protein